ncbi:uncharacterized protein LOC119079706 [Bradysia coprophila]|uniref:uncharacterized protein LOC119079706 n=1 Tax=Bradysia coprophila TaxID=38358 RepID=UPI00187DC97B|nr:uncharacterized protein LOC119079706 [Bradysia coprophila]
MNSLSFAQKMIALNPKYRVARSINQIPAIYVPSQIPTPLPNPSTQAADRLLLSWFGSAWNKTKNMVLDNWESAGLRKKRTPKDENRKSAAATNVNRDDNVSSPVDELAQTKNKAKKRLVENWDAIREANAITSRRFVDNAKEDATKTINELSKSTKKTADNLIDKTTAEIQTKIRERAEDVKGKISK